MRAIVRRVCVFGWREAKCIACECKATKGGGGREGESETGSTRAGPEQRADATSRASRRVDREH